MTWKIFKIGDTVMLKSMQGLAIDPKKDIYKVEKVFLDGSCLILNETDKAAKKVDDEKLCFFDAALWYFEDIKLGGILMDRFYISQMNLDKFMPLFGLGFRLEEDTPTSINLVKLYRNDYVLLRKMEGKPIYYFDFYKIKEEFKPGYFILVNDNNEEIAASARDICYFKNTAWFVEQLKIGHIGVCFRKFCRLEISDLIKDGDLSALESAMDRIVFSLGFSIVNKKRFGGAR